MEAPYPYFRETFAVSADINLLDQNGDDAMTTTAGGILAATEEESPSMIIPVVTALIAVVLCCLLGCFFYWRHNIRQKVEMSVTLSGIIVVTADTNAGAKEVNPKEGAAGAPRGLERPNAGPPPSEDLLVPDLEEIIMMRGLPRRRSDLNMAASAPGSCKRTRTLACIQEVQI